MEKKEFSEVYPNYNITDLESKIIPGDPRQPSHVQVIGDQREKISFLPVDDSPNRTFRFMREKRVDYSYRPVGGGSSGPECLFAPFAITFEENHNSVAKVHHQFYYKFDTSRRVKSTIEQRNGPDSLLFWVLRLFDNAGEELVNWSPMFTHSHRCSLHWEGSLSQSDFPKTELAWDVLAQEVGRLEMWPRYATYWYEYC